MSARQLHAPQCSIPIATRWYRERGVLPMSRIEAARIARSAIRATSKRANIPRRSLAQSSKSAPCPA